jgi:hypothetical protein
MRAKGGALTLLSIVACSGAGGARAGGADAGAETSSVVGNPPPPNAEAEFDAQVAAAQCAAIARCCDSEGYAAAPSCSVPRVALCSNPGFCPYIFDPDRGALGEVFVPGAAASCLATLEQTIFSPSNCSTVAKWDGGWNVGPMLIDLCPGLFAGGSFQQLPLGAACADANVDGSYKCAPAAGGVSYCATWDTTSADGTTSWNGCVEYVDAGAEGDVCSFYVNSQQKLPAAPTTLRAATTCAAGLYCSSSSRCAPVHGRGDACDPAAASCASGLYCDAGSSKCVDLPGAGATCAPVPQECAASLTCTTAGVCEPTPVTVDVGQPCDAEHVCAKGAYCDATASVCVALRGGGAQCGGGAECASGQCIQGTCTAAPPPSSDVPLGCAAR